MRRHNPNNDNKYYAYLPSGNSTPRNPSSSSSNRNTHYQYYDPRLRTRQQAQQTLYEYQYSNTSPERSPHSLYGSPHSQHHYQPPSFLEELPPSATSTIADLGEPISVFDDIQPLEYRRTTVTPSFALVSSAYMPPDPSRRPSASDVRLATAHVMRERLLTDIEHTINDIDRELTSLERRPSGPRYMPPRFPPIEEHDTQDGHLFRPMAITNKPISGTQRRPIPAIASPVQKPAQQTSAHSSVQERNSGNSKNWPNKPKRVYEVIPSLTSDSRKTSRQSSVIAQHEQIKFSGVQSPQSRPKTMEKSTSSSNVPLRGQYHYGPEVEEIEIHSNDPENNNRTSALDEMPEADAYETLNTEQFLRDLSLPPQNRAIFFVPEYAGSNETEHHELAEDLTQHDRIDTNTAQSLIVTSLEELTPAKDLSIQDTTSLIRTAPELQKKSEPEAHIASHELHHKTEDVRTEPVKPEPTKQSHPPAETSTVTPTVTHDHQQKSSHLEVARADPVATHAPLPPAAPADNNANSLVAYFFSDFGNEGEGEEDLMSIDQSNFAVPTGAEIIADDDISNSGMGQSQGSLLIPHSAHVLQQEQQQLTSMKLSSTENNSEHRKVEEKKEKESKKPDETKKHTPATTSILPSSSSSLPLREVLATAIIDNMQTQFTKNNSTSNNDHHQQRSTTTLNVKAADSTTEEQEKRSDHLQSRLRTSPSPTIPMRSRTQSAKSEKNEEQTKHNNQETRSVSSPSHSPLKTLDNENIPSPERLDSVTQRRQSSARTLSRGLSASSDRNNQNEVTTPIDYSSKSSVKNLDYENTQSPERLDSGEQRRKSSSRTLSRGLSATSRRSKRDETITPIDSSSKSSVENLDRENSTSRRTMSRQPSTTLSEQSHHSEQRKISPPRPSSNHQQTDQSMNFYLGTQSTTPTNDMHIRATHNNEPNTFSAESEHFLHHQSHTPVDHNQRLPSSYSMSHPDESRLSSSASSALPITLDSPDLDNNQPPTSRTSTAMKRDSASSVDALLDPNILMTTTDEPDPNDPSTMNSTLHFQILSSQQPNADGSVPDRDEPSPLVQMAPLIQVPIQTQSVELPADLLPTDENSRKSSSTSHRSPSAVLDPHEEIPSTITKRENHLRSLSPPLNHAEEQPPPIPYPARLKDLMHLTPSPTHSPHELKVAQNEEDQGQNGRLSSVSSPIHERQTHDHQPSRDQFQSSNARSPSNSPHRDESSDRNHTSVEGDDTYREQIDTPLVSSEKQRRTVIPSPKNPRFATEHQRRPSSEESVTSAHSHHNHQRKRPDGLLHRNDIQLSSASIKLAKKPSSDTPSSPVRPTSDDEQSPERLPSMTASQQHSKLSLRLRQPESKRKKPVSKQRSITPSSPLPHIDRTDNTSMQNDEDDSEEKPKQRRQRRRVSFSSSIAHFQMEERKLLTNWRERVAAILDSKHRPNEKYAHVQSRVNSFANFEYQPKKIKIVPKRKARFQMTEPASIEESKFIKRKKFKVKKPKIRPEVYSEDQVDDEDERLTQSVKEPAPQIFGRLWCLPDGSPTVFHEPLDWNVPSKLKGYSYENLNYEPHRNEFKVFDKKPKWHSESKLADLIKESPRSLYRPILPPTNSLPSIPDREEGYFYQQPSHQTLGRERKIFDIQTNTHQQSDSRLQHFPDNMSRRSYESRPSDAPIFSEKLAWTRKSKLKKTTWQNIGYQPKKSKVQIYHKSVHWNGEPKVRTRSPSSMHPSQGSTRNVQIFDQKLNWDAQAKVHCWSEIDLRQLTKKKALFAQYHDPKWNDIVTARVDATNYKYPKFSNNVEIFSDRLMWTSSSGLKDYIWENFDYRTHRRTQQTNDHQQARDTDQFRRANSPPNRPKWNAVSKTRSVNSVYNPKVTDSNTIRRGWDRELRRKRVHKLPPLKRKRDHEHPSQLAIDVPPATNQLALDFNYDHSSITQGRTTSNGYTTSSRRSSKALVPLNHHRHFPELELPTETPRSQRPVQQEWYDEMNKSRLTHRTDMGRVTNHSFRNSVDDNHQPNTPRELATFRSSTRNSQNSVMSGTLLDSSVRTNRTTEFRLSKDMEEHHHHSHTPNQSMPIEIRGFKLEGSQLSVPDHATIRPLSNVSYRASEQVKSRRVYPWSSLHPHGTSSRNSSLVPIAEFRRTSLDTSITEAQQLINEE